MKIQIADIFKDHMVLQREKSIHFFGKGEKKSNYKISFAGNEKNSIVSENGMWDMTFEPLKAGGPYTLIIEDCETTEKLEIQDIMVGDVYIAAGQSNMEFLFENSKGSENEKINVDKVNLRYWKVPQIEYKKDGKEYPQIDDDGWFLCTKENIGKVSAVAYYCAKEIRNHTDVPIGIIGCHKGGTSASCWISEESLQSEESLSDIYYDQYWNDIKNQTDEQEDREREKYQQCLKEYNQKVEDYKKKYPERSVSQLKHDVGHTPWPGPKGKKDYGRPSGLYHTMFSKIIGLSYKAVLWYQGEEDAKYAVYYERLLQKVVDNWREDLKDSKLPFFVIQLPDYNDDKCPGNWAIIRNGQEKIVDKNKHMYLICALGCGEEFNIHPTKKDELGKRLGLMMAEVFYNKDIKAYASSVTQIKKSDNLYKILFKNTYGELRKRTSKIVLECLTKNQGIHNIEAMIEKDGLIVSTNEEIFEIRYAWSNYPKVQIEGATGIPVLPFDIKLNI